MINFSQLFSPTILLIFLVGCESTSSNQASIQWENHQQKLANIQNYQAIGKIRYISIREKKSLNFQWEHTSKSSNLRLTNLFGQTVLNLYISSEGVRIITRDYQTVIDSNAILSMQKIIGLTMPVMQMQDWILGKPNNSDAYQLNKNYILVSLSKQIHKQLWKLEYLAYQNVIFDRTTLPLPKEIKLQHDNTKFHLIISKWTFN
ncbi:outer-membrane lipoprotein lolB [Candidatus Photodesmus blepharus]|uniref:Outer-membrane lipoprotein LolB n=1 Tax=Candidatus Photodesmus blepharonis TaxID=1179155 RepID=A0A084CPC3_9GAMM|nr:lipoprotein insertase outer membrane protein LolB [Candidatus Photodesmus blepharus]KEY91652.1 outer-membrane lipoprotein lolB [Candidatus Photodesmus blepharus]